MLYCNGAETEKETCIHSPASPPLCPAVSTALILQNLKTNKDYLLHIRTKI